MSVEIAYIYSSIEDEAEEYENSGTFNEPGDLEVLADVVVSLTNGNKYLAAFVDYEQLELLWEAYRQSGEYLSGTYFWTKNIILVKDCKKNTVQKVVKHMLDEGIFWDAFKKL